MWMKLNSVLVTMVSSKYFKYGFIGAFCFCVGFWIGKTHFPSIIYTVETEKVEIPVESSTNTKIQYVPRPLGSNAQVSVQTTAPKVIASANGKEYEFKALEGETQVFEKGQLQIQNTATTKIDLTDIVNQQEKKNTLSTSILAGRDNQYVGLEYQAKMWNAGYYRNIHGSGDRELYKVGYTIARW